MAEAKKSIVNNGVHSYTAIEEYVAPQNSVVAEQLRHFQDQKLGLMMHWSAGSQLGIYESWCMSDDSAHWSKKDVDWTEDMALFREQYRGMAKSFNPVRFQPEEWAELAYSCGFKYLLFTTKHHDGFCMWDTKTTDYKITDQSVPFSTHQYADICRHLFDAFRRKGLGIHAYFSKPDWDSPYYWSPGHQSLDGKTQRNVNYNVEENPELWNKYVNYTHDQITELMTDYGKIDALWLDGGWVRADNKGQDLKIGEIAEEIRTATQPHLLVADRTVGGAYENFITPEQTVPSEAIPVPWESCVTLGKRFSFNYDEEFKSAREIIHLLINVIAKGGNLALNIAPQPDGRLPQRGIAVLKELGGFLKQNGEAVYGTRACAPYVNDDVAFTKKENYIYVFYLYDEDQLIPVTEINLPYFGKIVSAVLLGTNEAVQFTADSETAAFESEHDLITTVRIAPRSSAAERYADVIRLELQ